MSGRGSAAESAEGELEGDEEVAKVLRSLRARRISWAKLALVGLWLAR